MNKEKVIIVDEDNNEIGTEEKIKAHKGGFLHRAFSIFVFNFKGELLIQQRAKEKYHCGELWSNTVCSHPKPNEILEDAIHRRLKEEMGFDCGLKEVFSFIYLKEFENGLTEHEFDHVFVGKFDGGVLPNKEEVMNYKWISIDELKKNISENPEKYTYWFRVLINEHLEKLLIEV
ncbi:isopentenyl-diphosphate Delta-isomerase [Candidatus Pacearchaeota archaeon]|nr:isopentenyl-diphosphate Delta-isomerase [Candidatus Pacearchaeota archaeon]